MRIRPGVWLASVLLLFACRVCNSAAEEAGRHVLIFAPEMSPVDAGVHQNAARALRKRFMSAGIAERNLVLLAGAEATADHFQQQLWNVARLPRQDELFLVLIHAPGISLGGADFVATCDTDLNTLRRRADASLATLPRVQEIVNVMSTSASGRRLLVIDGAGDRLPEGGRQGATFGTGELRLTDNQWVVLNRSPVLSRRERPTGPLTAFAQALLDGLSWHADGNSDQQVSLFELSEYLKLYAEDQQLVEPRILGKTGADFDLISVKKEFEGDLTLAQRERNAMTLFRAAQRALLAEFDGVSALEHLSRARRLAPPGPARRAIREFAHTAEALNGDIETAWQRSHAEKSPLLFLLQNRVGLFPPRQTSPSRQLPAGSLLTITSLKQGKFMWVTQVVRPRLSNGVMEFQSVPIEPGWIKMQDLKAETSRGNRLEALLAELYVQR